jgi:hypothetical protein
MFGVFDSSYCDESEAKSVLQGFLTFHTEGAISLQNLDFPNIHFLIGTVKINPNTDFNAAIRILLLSRKSRKDCRPMGNIFFFIRQI